MAVLDNSLLRDLFQNNIDFLGKQWSRILDAIYGEQNSDENTVIQNTPLIYHTTQYMGSRGSYIKSGMTANNQVGTFAIDIDDRGFTLTGLNQTFITTDASTDAQIAILNSDVKQFLSDYSFNMSMEQLNADHFFMNGTQIRKKIRNSNSIANFALSTPYGIDAGQNINWTGANVYTAKQTYILEDRSGKSFYRYGNLSFFISPNSNELKLYSLGGDNPSSFVLMPSSDSIGVNTIVNQYTNTVEYNGDTIYNYYNDNGDIVINGGGIGAGGVAIAPVVGLNYNDFKFILDSLIDDLNLTFDGFGGDPLPPAKTLDEIRYVDMGSFYITPVKQLDKLPVAPDIADTVIDVSEPLGMLSTGFGALLSAFDSLGVTLTITFTFLACLVINKLRGD